MTGYDIERYLNVRRASSATFGPGGERLAFRMDTTGTRQVWALDAPGSWPEQLTFYEERVRFVDWSPTREELAFGKDEGGNERNQLFRLDADGESVVQLTEEPEAKHGWGGWSNDGDRFAFVSNRREESVFDIYVQGRDEESDEATLVYEGDGWYDVRGWSPDDSMLAVHVARSNFDHDVYVLDLESGDLDHLTPHDGEVRYKSLNWTPDGDGFYLVTDQDSDTLYLARLGLDGEFEVVEDGGEWNVDGINVHQDTGRFVFSRNVDGFTELTVGEFTGETSYRSFPEPELPPGTRGGTDFSPDGERIALTVSGRGENPNIHVFDVKTGEAERWTRAATAGIPKETFVDSEAIRYESFDGLEIPALYSVPEDANEGETPVLVDVHGGPESQRRPSFRGLAQYFLDQGYALFEPNVRGSTGYGREYTHLDDVRNRMDSVADLEAAVEWLHDRPEVDPDRIAVIGGSYGGFMVLAAMTEYPDLWAAGVDIVGIANLVTFLENTGDWRRELREVEYGSLEDDREFLEEISPVNRADRIDAPLFVAHGANDPRVPVGEAEQIAEEAREQGVPVELLVFEDEGHGFSKLENRIEAYTSIAAFLDEHV